MKKLLTFSLIAATMFAISATTYAQGRGAMHGQHGSMMKQGRGMMMRGQNRQDCPCMKGNADAGATAELIAADKAKEAAQAYLDKYLTGYTIEKIEKDSWRPMYLAAIKSANGAEQVMWIHGFSAQVMHVFPKTTEQPQQTQQPQPTQQ